MKTIKYKLVLFSLAILVSGGLLAQEKHQVSVWGAGGLSTLKYKTSSGKQDNGFGGAFGLGYTYFFSERWGLGTGAELSIYQSKTKLDGLKDSYEIIDVLDDERAILHIDAKNYTEKQRLMTINIPLMLQYQTEGHHRFYAALGGKIGLPVLDKFKISNGEYDVSAYYPSTNQTLTDPMYPAGYGRHSGVNVKGELDFKVAFIASAEAGMKWKLQEGLSLYTGAYFDYGLNNIDKNSKGKNVIEYLRETPTSIKSNSIMQSRNTKGHAYIGKVRPIAFGLKVKLAFDLSKMNCPKKTIEVVPIIPEISAEEIEARLRAEEEERLAEERAREEEEERLRKEKEAEEQEELQKEVYQQAKRDAAFSLNDFQLGKAAISEDIKTKLDKSIGALKAHPEMKIYCIGYTCDKGTTAINIKLSTQRAESIKDYMVKGGIEANRIIIKAEGEKNPAYPNTSEANRRLNRRVEVIVHE